jgi:plastocyanin
MISVTKIKFLPGWVFLVIAFFPVVAFSYDEVEIKAGGVISGFVRYQGKAEKAKFLEVTKNREVCGKVADESLVVGVGQGLRYAVVTLEGIARGKAVEREAVHELDNVKCRFAPHVQTATVGQFLLVKNSDPILHTAHAYTPEGQPHFNVGLYPGRVSRKPLVKPGVFKILCEAHPWMSAYVVVSEHPYHAVTDAYGEYQLTEVPAGKYRLRVWHEKLGVKEQEVEVRPGAVTKADFVLAPPTGAKR